MEKSKILKSKKGFTMSDMSSIAVSLVTVAIVLGIGASILTSVQTGQTVNSSAYNTSNYGLTSVNTLASYIPTVALVAVAAIVVGIIFAFFMNKR